MSSSCSGGLDLTVQIPYHFRCPISLELMQDPVILSTGQTYDRSSIQSWISTGPHHSTCPVTRLPIPDSTLIPNLTLRRLIQQWSRAVSNRDSSGIQRIPTPKHPIQTAAVRSLLNQASAGINSSSSRLSALRRLRALCNESEKNRIIISDLGTREVLLAVIFTGKTEIDLIGESIAILAEYLPLRESDCGYVAADYSKMSLLASLLFDSSFEIRVNSAAVIESVVAATRSEMSNADEIYRGIIGILNSSKAHPRAIKIGIKAVFAMCLVKQHRQMAVAAGAAEAVVGRLPDLEKCDSERALATVELLCRIPNGNGCSVFAGYAMTVPILVKIILKISDRATEYAAGALLSICSASESCRREAVAAGVWTQLLRLVQSDCTERAKRKAQMMMKLVRDVLPEESTAINSDEFGFSDAVVY